MNDGSLPKILKDRSRFASAARAAAHHILNQPAHIDIPISIYGDCLFNKQPVTIEILLNFYRAMSSAGVDKWTDQLVPYPAEHGRLEDLIAKNVYMGHLALKEGVKEESCS